MWIGAVSLWGFRWNVDTWIWGGVTSVRSVLKEQCVKVNHSDSCVGLFSYSYMGLLPSRSHTHPQSSVYRMIPALLDSTLIFLVLGAGCTVLPKCVDNPISKLLTHFLKGKKT